MKINVKKLSEMIFEEGLVTSQPEVATGRKVFWANFGPKKPTQVIVTDGALVLHPNPDKIGAMKYEISAKDDPSYLLIVQYNEQVQRWEIVYTYFFHKHRLNIDRLRSELRLLHASNMSVEDLEYLLQSRM